MISSLMADPVVVAKMDKIVALCKRRGFIFQSSEIYGGLNGAWDYGPLGVELKRNLKDYWWKCMTQLRDDIVGFDGSILMNAAVWKASGHVDTFSDPLVECMLTKKRYRADQIEPQSGTAYYYFGVIKAPAPDSDPFLLSLWASFGPIVLKNDAKFSLVFNQTDQPLINLIDHLHFA